jgi:hypothetical protein
MTGAKTKPTTRMMVTFDGPSEVSAHHGHQDDRQREDRLDEPAQDVVDRAAEVARDEPERGAEDGAEQRRGRRDEHDVARGRRCRRSAPRGR